KQTELTRIAAVLGLRLQIDLVDTAEAIEVVDVRTAEQRAERGVDVGELHAGLHHLAAIDVRVDLRHHRAIQRRDTTDLRSLPRRVHEALRLLGEICRRAAAAILQLNREARAGSQAGNRRRTEGDDGSPGDLTTELSIERLDHALRMQRFADP